MEDNKWTPGLNYSLENLPKTRVRGYDQRATEQLFERLNRSYAALRLERESFEQQLQELQTTLAEQRDKELRLAEQRDNEHRNDVERLRADLEASQQQAKSLAERLDQADRAAATIGEELEHARAEAEHDLELLRTELGRYKNREDFVTEMLEVAKRTVHTTREDARAEAEGILKKAKKREAEMLSDVQRERTRLEEDRRRVAAEADKLREDLSGVLISTLDQLTNQRAQDAAKGTIVAISEGTGDRRKDRSGAAVSEPGPSEDQAQPVVTSLDSVRKESASSS